MDKNKSKFDNLVKAGERVVIASAIAKAAVKLKKPILMLLIPLAVCSINIYHTNNNVKETE